MAKAKSKKEELFRDRKFMLLLYPDNADHVQALETIKKSYDYAYIKHDKDPWTDADQKKNSEHIAGTLKKSHWHVVIKTKNAIWNSALQKELGIESKFIEQTRKVDSALQYLMHYNDIEKVQYPIDDVQGPLKKVLKESINKLEKSEGEKVCELIDYIDKLNKRITVKDFAHYCASNGYWAEFRRSASIFLKIIDDHNTNLLNSNERG